MAKIFVVGLEKLENRYTSEWYNHIPNTLESISNNTNKNYDIVIVDGDDIVSNTTPGAFLNFASTNLFKSGQLAAISEEFYHNRVAAGDIFLFTDAWNPTVISVKYMSDLLDIPIKLHGLWHAGQYDSWDILGQKLKNKPWIKNAELSMFECYDTNWFATKFHMDMFIDTMFGTDYTGHEKHTCYRGKTSITGWPMEYMRDTLLPYSKLPKLNQIVFPHRLASEKQLNIFKDLSKEIPEYNWIVCQEHPLSKKEYHKILGESKILFSASLQETLGISVCSEGPLTNTIPLAPSRLSYIEIFNSYNEFIYPSDWTLNYESYLMNKHLLIDKIKTTMNNYNNIIPKIEHYCNHVHDTYFGATNLYNSLLN